MGMRLAKRVAVGAVAVVSAVTAMLLVNAWRIGRPLPSRGPALSDAVDENAVARHLAGALQLATVSHEDPAQDAAAVRAQFGEYLRVTFPRVHATLARESVRGGFLYTWRGTDSSLPPVLF